MKRIFQGTAILLLTLLGFGFSQEMLKKSHPVEEYDDEPIRYKKRKPASFVEKKKDKPFSPPDRRVTSARAGDNDFRQNANLPEERFAEGGDTTTGDPGYQAAYGGGYQGHSYGNGGRGNSSNSNPSSGRTDSSSSSPSNGSQVSSGSGMVFSNVGLPPSTTPTNNTNTPYTEPKTEDPLSCSASVGGGAFGNPIQVSITCSATANIRYCVQEGSCCDPEYQGYTYSAPVVIGADSGNYCLSFYGETSSYKTSSIVQQSYTINNTYPDLQLTFPKVHYQTTQLAGSYELLSNDFGKSNYWVGGINLKTHDPGPSGLNMDCQEIVETYVTLPAPTPSVVFNPMDMALINFGDKLIVPLQRSSLMYGENFVTSYVLNDNYAAPLYSCSTKKISLKDFEYFAQESSHGEAVTNQVRQFSGSFVAYSFFEPDATVFRGPAGVATEEDAGQELRLGSFGIFY